MNIGNFNSILDIKNITEVPHENSSIRKPYQEYYTDKSIRFVEKNFKSDLDFFDYKF